VQSVAFPLRRRARGSRCFADAGSWVVTAAYVQEGRGALVLWFANLRLPTRAAVVTNMVTGEVERVTVLEVLMGLMHTLEQGTKLLAAQEVPVAASG